MWYRGRLPLPRALRQRDTGESAYPLADGPSAAAGFRQSLVSLAANQRASDRKQGIRPRCRCRVSATAGPHVFHGVPPAKRSQPGSPPSSFSGTLWPAPSKSSKMKWIRSRSLPVMRPVPGEVVHLPGVAGEQMEGGSADGHCRPRVGLQWDVDLVHERDRRASVHVQIDALPGLEPRQHGLGKDGFGEAVGRGNPLHHRQQPRPPQTPARSCVESPRILVVGEESEDEMPGMSGSRRSGSTWYGLRVPRPGPTGGSSA